MLIQSMNFTMMLPPVLGVAHIVISRLVLNGMWGSCVVSSFGTLPPKRRQPHRCVREGEPSMIPGMF